MLSTNIGMTIAVEDIDSAAPIASADGGAKAETPGGGAQNQRRHDDLREPKPEHQITHAPQALERQLEPHREQERDDAKGGDAVDRVDIDRQRVEPRRFQID